VIIDSPHRNPFRRKPRQPHRGQQGGRVNLIDVKTRLQESRLRLIFLLLALVAVTCFGQSAPPSGGGFFPLSEVHAGLTGTAWTVFRGSQPEPMQVEILGVLRGARGPGHDMILAQLHGDKPQYTGVVAGMSGSPVYIGNRLLGALSYRIGQFAKDPIAGITPIAQMLEVRDLPQTEGRELSVVDSVPASPSSAPPNLQAMETPLVMGGFLPAAVQLWQQKMAGSSLEIVAAGGMSGASALSSKPSPADWKGIVPGSAVSAQLVRGDFEIAATCTVTYVDPKQLLACGHPLLQAGPVSLPMTATEVVTTLASPMNSYKIINTGATIGAFNQDRDSAIRGSFGTMAHMIPVHIHVHGLGVALERSLNLEVLDLPAMTPQAILVSVYNALLQSNDSAEPNSYHLTGAVHLENNSSMPLNLWALSGDGMPAPMEAALLAGDRFLKIYASSTRSGDLLSVDLDAEAIPHHVDVELASARIVSGDIVHAGDTVVVEATLRPWRQPARNLRLSFVLPARLAPGNLRLLVSDANTLDHTLDQPRQPTHSTNLDTTLAQARSQHQADRIYLSLLAPETQAAFDGRALPSLPLSVANAFEPLRNSQDASLNGESLELLTDSPVNGVLIGFTLLNLRIEPGGGLD
jgi:hypothetical protein